MNENEFKKFYSGDKLDSLKMAIHIIKGEVKDGMDAVNQKYKKEVKDVISFLKNNYKPLENIPGILLQGDSFELIKLLDHVYKRR